MKLMIEPVYHCVSSCAVELPIESFDEVKGWFVKWHTFHYTTDGNTWQEIALNDLSFDCIATKHPEITTIYDEYYSKEYAEN